MQRRNDKDEPNKNEWQSVRFRSGKESGAEQRKPNIANAAAIAGPQCEVERRQNKNYREKIVPDAAGLQQKTITRRQHPHPYPGDLPRNSKARNQPEDQAGQKKKRNDIDQEEETIGVSGADDRRGDPFDAAGAVIHTIEFGVNPMPAMFRQPMQNAGNPISQSIVIGRRIESPAQKGQTAQNEKG